MVGRPDLQVVRDDLGSTPSARAREPSLGLSWVDSMAATALVEGTAVELAEFLELVRNCAQSLVSDDAIGARRRLLARELAIAKFTLDATTASIGRRMRANDATGAMLADRLATSAARRLALLAAALRAETAPERRPSVVAIGIVDHVTVEAER